VDATATLTNSVVDCDCVVGANVVLEETVLLPGAIVQSNCVIRSSIIGPGAVIGRYSQLGATCVVGAGERVAPASELSGDVRLGGV
jgi:ADP-glucose pyrophosphorylase